MRKALTILTAMTALSLVLVAPAGAESKGTDRASVVREWNEDGTAASGTEVVGRSHLIRSDSGLKATVQAEGLIPGGVYTFWWVVPHAAEPAVPFDVFVARGAGTVVGPNGKTTVRMRADTDQPGIAGFPPLGGLEWHALTDPMNSVVRIEIAYHGQAADAGSDLETWMSDFWTGSACPPDTANPNPAQPHCPVYFAATHLP